MGKFSELIIENRKVVALVLIIILEIVCFFYFKPSQKHLPVTIVKYKNEQFAKKYKHLSGEEIKQIILDHDIQAKTAVFHKIEKRKNPITIIKDKNGVEIEKVKKYLSDKEIQSILSRYPKRIGPGYAIKHDYKTRVYRQDDYKERNVKEILKIFDGKLTQLQLDRKLSYLKKTTDFPRCSTYYDSYECTKIINLETNEVVQEVVEGHFSEKDLIEDGTIDMLIKAKEISRGYFVIHSDEGVKTDVFCNSEKIKTFNGSISDKIFIELKNSYKIKMVDIKKYKYKHEIEKTEFPILDWVACAFAIPFALIFLFQYISNEEEEKAKLDYEKISNSPGKMFLIFDYMQSTTSFACMTALLGTFAIWSTTKSIIWVAERGYEFANKLVIPIIVSIVVVVVLLIIAKMIASIFISKYYYQAEIELAKINGGCVKAIDVNDKTKLLTKDKNLKIE